MDLNRVALFVRVVDDGGFTAAARSLRLPKSSVSRGVSLLEDELGALLLQRSTRRVHLTDVGRAFYDRASRGIAGVEEAAASVADRHGSLRGSVSVTAAADVGVGLLGPVVARFVKRHPEVRVDVLLTNRLVDLANEGVDLAVRAGTLKDSSLVARRLAPIEAHLYASSTYLAKHGRPKRVDELARHACVLFRAQRGRATWLLRGPSGEESVDVTGPVSVDDFSFVRQAIALGVGVGLLPSFLCAPDGGRAGLVRVLSDVAGPAGVLHLVYPAGRYVPNRVATLRDFLLRELGPDERAKPR